MNQTYCSHCWPTKRKSHALSHIEFYLEKLCSPLALIIEKVGNYWPTNQGSTLFELLARVGAVKFESEIDETKFHNRSLIFFNEAKKLSTN